MSSTTIKAVWLGNKTEDLLELRNSHGSAPVVWNELAKRYLGVIDHSYSLHGDEIWPLYKRDDMPPHHRSVLLITYDNAIVMKSDFKRAASDIRAFLTDFPPENGYVNHWSKIAEIFESDPDCEAIGFWMTSVSCDPFSGWWNEEIGDYDAPDWDVYWNIYTEADKWPGALNTK